QWPGNIRELENVLSRAAILCDGEEIRSGDLDQAGLGPAHMQANAHAHHLGPAADAGQEIRGEIDAGAGRPLKRVIEDTVRAVERRAILEALEKSSGSPARAARLLGVSRATMYNKLKEYGVPAKTR